LQQQLPESPDANGDGVIDDAEFAAINAIVEAWKTGDISSAESGDGTSDESTASASSELFEPTPAFE
jgi:hypothetical protein